MSGETLTDFLLARIAEDEGAARLATSVNVVVAWEEPPVPKDVDLWDFNPARVLAECEAKRRIVELHTEGSQTPYPFCPVCISEEWGGEPYPCSTLRLLALPYADHPDYREEWKP